MKLRPFEEKNNKTLSFLHTNKHTHTLTQNHALVMFTKHAIETGSPYPFPNGVIYI